MFRMDRAISGESMDFTAQFHAEAHCVSRITDTNFLNHFIAKARKACGTVKHQIHALAEVEFFLGRCGHTG